MSSNTIVPNLDPASKLGTVIYRDFFPKKSFVTKSLSLAFQLGFLWSFRSMRCQPLSSTRILAKADVKSILKLTSVAFLHLLHLARPFAKYISWPDIEASLDNPRIS